MILNIYLYLILLLAPAHDFHTTFMNLTYQDDEKSFEIDLTVDTEHFEHVINEFSDTTLRLGEPNEHADADKWISKYIRKTIKVQMNGKNIPLELRVKEVNFAETTLHFKPVKHKRKLKNTSIRNSFMINDFPNQKNLVKINYKGNSKSMLFDYKTLEAEVEF